jgi:hypothetical protein
MYENVEKNASGRWVAPNPNRQGQKSTKNVFVA